MEEEQVENAQTVANVNPKLLELFYEKKENFEEFFLQELFDAKITKEVQEMKFEDLVQKACQYQPYLHFIEAGTIAQLDILFALAASLSEDATANLVGATYKRMAVDKKEKLVKYLKFFLHCVEVNKK
jgi:hypothetical protein